MNNDTNQTKPLLDENGKFAKGNTPPAGFNEHPENRSDGGWKKEDSYSYQLNLMDRMTVTEFKNWQVNNPEDKRTMAQKKAYHAQTKCNELSWLKEVTDRTEGKAQQFIDHTSKGDKILGATIVFAESPEPED